MAEESDLEKTEPASAQRIEKAREDGNVPQSRELMAFMVMAAGAATFWILGSWMAYGVADILRSGLSFDRNAAFDTMIMREGAVALSFDALALLFPIFLAVLAAIMAVPAMMGSWVVSPKAFKLDLARMSPIKGFGRMFSWHSIAELVKAILKATLIGGVLYWIVNNEQDRMFSLLMQPIEVGTDLVFPGLVLQLRRADMRPGGYRGDRRAVPALAIP